jgi:hypothetical protein
MLESSYAIATLWEQQLQEEGVRKTRRPEQQAIRAHTGFVDYLFRITPHLTIVDDTTPRFIPSPSSFGNRWDSAGARIMPMIDSGRLALPLQYQPSFGNPFIYVMEYYCRLITTCIDSILFANSMLDEVKTSLGRLHHNDVHYVRNYNDTVSLLEKATASIRAQERELASWLRGLRAWVHRYDLQDESEEFFCTYTECYYGQSFMLEGLYWWFEVDGRL